ncbi:hypothetical protein N7533_011588 [Penicillium manginii]|uniref:uncharacterized protein n=1 Tax=Penicillium manginii TaxID=203109 RepID=UPI002547AAFE|nr:uncharacterized protein N7533_011588 [Penicillium manginii]KAJ5742179.1 hypothetical protein N7533_011588 [Penicillium manginii]
MRIGLRHFPYKTNDMESYRYGGDLGSQKLRDALLQCPSSQARQDRSHRTWKHDWVRCNRISPAGGPLRSRINKPSLDS